MAEEIPTPAAQSPAVRRGSVRRRRLFWAVGTLLICAGVWTFRAPLLRQLGNVLVVDEPVASAGAVWIVDADHGIDETASLYHAGLVPRVLLVGGTPRRLDRLEVYPDDLLPRELMSRNIPEAAFVIVTGDGFDDWEIARMVGEWLEREPDTTLIALCNRFGSRRRRMIFDTMLSRSAAARVKVVAKEHRRYDTAAWWRDSEGILAFVNESVSLVHVAWYGNRGVKWREADMEHYATTLR